MKRRGLWFAIGLLLLAVAAASWRFWPRVAPPRSASVTPRAVPSLVPSLVPSQRRTESALGGAAAVAAARGNARPDDATPSAEVPTADKERPPYLDVDATTLADQRRALFTNMANQLSMTPVILDKVENIFVASNHLGQGEPKITKHPMTRAECRAIRAAHREAHPADPGCGAPNMVPVFDPTRGETAASATLCMDQFEFPNIPCEYPVTWVRANEAAALCEAEGKRLCDAHEWEGACAGALHTPEVDYTWGERRLMQEYLHNKTRELIWAYGPKAEQRKCATMSHKSRECYTPDWGICGSNTYPAGAFPDCVSNFGVYDQHGNAAEHMNLPLKPEELGKNGGVGETEMKGSWFIFAREAVHADDCRWRALAWHAGPIRALDSHRNYHLGFRCCKDIAAGAASGAPRP